MAKRRRICLDDTHRSRSSRKGIADPGAALASQFLDELRLQPHGADTVDFAVDVVIAIDQADVLDLGANLDDR